MISSVEHSLSARRSDSRIARMDRLTFRSAFRGGFTLLEVLITISIIAGIAILAAPMFSDDTRLRLVSASAVLYSDIELAQVMNIAHPDEPVVVRFDPANDQYWLATAADPDTPMPREPTGEPYIVVFGEGRARMAEGVTYTIVDIAGDTLAFNAQGGLEDFTSMPEITLSLDGRQIDITISASTGRITENEIESD